MIRNMNLMLPWIQRHRGPGCVLAPLYVAGPAFSGLHECGPLAGAEECWVDAVLD